MKERPIIFSAPMVRAILEGRMTQTRRIIKPQPTHFNPAGIPRRAHGDGTSDVIGCPYGKPGDRLWVRETWGLTGRAANSRLSDFSDPALVLKDNLIHRAGCDGYDESVQHWRPSIHMPRWASRIDLEITGIRVERLHDVSEADAIAEGVDGEKEAAARGATWYDKPKRAYRFLWESINGAGSWDKNPWVWVIEFKRINRSAE